MRGNGSSCNGTQAEPVFSEIVPVQVEVARDTSGSFELQIVKTRERRLSGIEEIVLSLTARALTTVCHLPDLTDLFGVAGGSVRPIPDCAARAE